MKDRERILTHILQCITVHYADIDFSFSLKSKEFKEGSILIARTNFTPDKWRVAYFDHYDNEKYCVVVKDLITGKLCDYYNESFIEIKKEWVCKYELLIGKKYKIYQYCDKYRGRFHSLEFNDEDNTFTFKDRLPFHDEPDSSITMSIDLSLKEIKEKLLYSDSSDWVVL